MKKLLRKIHRYFIPHQENDFKAHIFRDTSLGILTLIVVLTFVAGVAQKYALTTTNYLAAIYSGVLVDLANEDRIENSLQPLKINPVLESAAELKAQDMALKGYFAHYGPDGSAPWDWMKKAGYEFIYAGENLAIDFTDSEDVDDAWMNSPTHKANILNPKYTEVGIATIKGKYNGRNTIYVVQMFGTPNAKAQETLPLVTAVPINQLAVNTTPAGEPEVQGASVSEPTPLAVKSPKQTQSSEDASKKTVLNKIDNNESSIEIITDSSSTLAAISETIQVDKDSKPVEFAKKVTTNPSKALDIIYGVVSLLLIIGLGAMIRKDIDTHHLSHAIGGIAVMFLIVSLTYIYNHAIFSDTVIVAVNTL